MKVLVMGGTQFNGLALVRELCHTGHDVTILNRGKTAANLPGVRRLYADRTDAGQLRTAVGHAEFDYVYDISAYQPEDVQSMVDLLRGRVGHYIFASSTVIYAAANVLPITEDHPVDRGENQWAYGINKLACEDILVREYRQHGFPATIVYFSMVFGPHNLIPDREQRMFVRLFRGRPVLIPGDGTTLGQIGHVYDEARALRLMMQNTKTFGRRYNLTGADVYTDEGYVDTFAEVLGVHARKVFVPAEIMNDLYAMRIPFGGESFVAKVDAANAARVLGGDNRMAQLFQLQKIMQRCAPNIHGWNRNLFFSIDRLKRDVGWEPHFTFRGAVEQTWEWMRAERLHETLNFDFEIEDELIKRVGVTN